MDLNADLSGIANLMRSHIAIRNRSWMKMVHKNCFLGSDAVDFLVMQGLVSTREEAVAMGTNMLKKKLFRHVGDSSQFKDSYIYYSFAEDCATNSFLASSNAGNGNGTVLGKGGCKWSFAPHTAHNSYVLDIALTEEIERAVAGASVEARMRAISKLRERVREQAVPDAPDWQLRQSTEVNGVDVNVYERVRPRGDFKNVKMTGKIAESPQECIRGIFNFEKRKQRERMFEDGIVVEAIDIGEKNPFSDVEKNNDDTEDDILFGIAEPSEMPHPSRFLDLPDSEQPLPTHQFARTTDDTSTFLQTVDTLGIPRDMPIAFLNDPERQHALSHLRQQMMQVSHQECMLCSAPFGGPTDYRFCPCCASICCANCVSKRVFEVVSRQTVSVCVHCYRESSRIRQPPQALQDDTNINESLKGKWWRPDELGLPDFSGGSTSVILDSALNDGGVEEEHDPDVVDLSINALPLLPGLLDSDEAVAQSNAKKTMATNEEEEDHVSSMFIVEEEPDEVSKALEDLSLHDESTENNVGGTKSTVSSTTSVPPRLKSARCKKCGESIPRDVESIEKHMDLCSGLANATTSSTTESNEASLGGITRDESLNSAATRIIYHTARTTSKLYRPREVCAIQDCFIDKDGKCYSYEISVRHCDVSGIKGHRTAEVLLLMHVASPCAHKDMCDISIISQIDSKSKAPKWMLSLTEEGGGVISAPRRMDLVRELKSCGNLRDILAGRSDGDDEESSVSLNDFELLAVLGRGGFGKVMQVRHNATGSVFAMKILKKSELQRRRQVERTKTERTILAAIQHPFIVRLHYAFQNNQKLYMVMDFVQGGDFFTLMRKYRRLPEDWVRIYVCEVAMALHHLHEMEIVYRDLKPENILLCGDGHLKLTDFGLSRFFETRPPAAEDMVGEDPITRSFCGTEQYMSPEMLLQQGHNWRMDWWCLGLLMHEMLSARHPFHGPSHYDTLRNMVTKQPVIDARVSKEASIVIRGLLIKNPRARLCCRNGLSELKTLPFFSGVDWTALYNKTTPVPHVPMLGDITDTSSFENTFTREAAVDSVADDPKTKSRRKGGGIMGLFGFNMQSSPSSKAGGGTDDSFSGFSFAHDEEKESEK
jgi:serine/threonine protein kinase